jgi:hypothetical protein
MPPCPVCGSEMVYPLLNTWRCKRCKYIWKTEDETPGSAACGCPVPDTSARAGKRIEPLEKRIERRLDACLARSGGKFCITGMRWQAGDIPFELFRKYLRRCVKDRTLEETKDRYGRTWYSRPG